MDSVTDKPRCYGTVPNDQKGSEQVMDIFDVLDYGDIVAHDEDRQILITYNGSATYNAWLQTETGTFHNFDVRTVYVSDTLHEARREGKEWISEMGREWEHELST